MISIFDLLSRAVPSAAIAATGALVAGALCLPAPASAEFGLNGLVASYTDPAEAPETRAGAHPAASTTTFNLNTRIDPKTALTLVEGGLRDLQVGLPAGLAGNARVMQTCETADFLTEAGGRARACPNDTVVGYLDARVSGGLGIVGEEIDPLYNLIPDPGQAAKLGAYIGGEPQLIEINLNPAPPHNLIASITETTQIVEVRGSDTIVWGNPASPAHNTERGACAVTDPDFSGDPFDDDACPPGFAEQAYLTMPRSCTGQLQTSFAARAWWSGNPLAPDPVPASFAEAVFGLATEDCAVLGFDPAAGAAPTTDVASSPSGFEFSIEIDDPKLIEPAERADSDLKKAVVVLPEGLTVNPAAAGGLAACSEAQLAGETPSSALGEGCPGASRVAAVEVETPLLEEHLSGSIFLAEPYTNPLGELLAGFLVLKQPERGVVVRLAGKIEADPQSGRLVASFDQNPQLPFSDLAVSFFAGPRAPLSTPDLCGTYEVTTELHPWSGSPPDVSAQPFSLTQDPNPSGGACPTGPSELPHSPRFDAGSVSPIAAQHSPFVLNLRREDGEQRFKEVTISPPPGLTAKLAGTATCPEAALAAATQRKGAQEQASPSCPAGSKIGQVYAAVGSGPSPYWASGAAYLAPPYKGAPLSMAIVTPAVAGPFDLGVVVIRAALYVDPVTARISAVSDPIPQFLEGIPLDVRAASVRLDKPGFVLNGTSCDPTQITGTLTSTLGAVAPLNNRFQLGECVRLGFRPKLSLRLKGATRRGGHPQLTATISSRPGDANIRSVSVAFPRSEFLDQAHIRTICTRPQFAAGSCPPDAVYGTSTVYTPILDRPLSGNVYLRSSDNKLPDLVPDLRGPAEQPIKVEAAGRTDSIRGGIRNTFDFLPDAPFARAVLKMQGGKKGLLVNSRDICKSTFRARVRFVAHNGMVHTASPELRADCKGKGKGKRRKAKNGARRVR